MAIIDPSTTTQGLFVVGIFVFWKAIDYLESKFDRRVEIFLNTEARLAREKKLIADETSHLATSSDLEKTHRIAKHMEASCTQCAPLKETRGLRREDVA